MVKKYRFFRENRITTTEKYSHIFKNAEHFSNRNFKFFYLIEPSEKSEKIGIIISKKVKGSVLRNRQKRIIREYFRLHKNMLKPGVRIVIIIYNVIKPDKYSCFSDEMDKILKEKALLSIE